MSKDALQPRFIQCRARGFDTPRMTEMDVMAARAAAIERLEKRAAEVEKPGGYMRALTVVNENYDQGTVDNHNLAEPAP